jgi:DinB superfamily
MRLTKPLFDNYYAIFLLLIGSKPFLGGSYLKRNIIKKVTDFFKIFFTSTNFNTSNQNMALLPNQVYESFVSTLDHYKSSLAQYTDEQFNTKPSAEEWSLSEMYEHITASAAGFFLKNIQNCLAQTNGQIGGDKNEWADKVFKYNSLPPVKIKMPESLKSLAPAPVLKSRETYQNYLDKIKKASYDLIESVAANNGEYKCLHPPFGWLTAQEWYQMMDAHTRHHLRQKETLEAWLRANGI